MSMIFSLINNWNRTSGAMDAGKRLFPYNSFAFRAFTLFH
jgi:hypothetical protein